MDIKSSQKKIRQLLKEKNAILLVHNYQKSEIQDIADLTGDSLGLSIEASKTDAEIIVFVVFTSWQKQHLSYALKKRFYCRFHLPDAPWQT